MKAVSIHDFCMHPRAASEVLSRNEDAVLTDNGKPLAIMIPVNAETFDAAIDLVRRMRAIRTVSNMRLRAAQTGADKLTMAQIDKIIAKSRRERRTQARRTDRH